MNKRKVLLVSLLSLIAVGNAVSCNGKKNPWKDKIVVIHTSNLRGDLDKLSHIAGLFDYVVDMGGDPVLVDTGNFLQGSKYSTYDSGEMMVKMMVDTGYSSVAIGHHEFDFGVGKIGVEQHEVFYEDGSLGSFVSKYRLNAISSNVKTSENTLYKSGFAISTGSKKKIGFAGATNVDTSKYVVSSNLEGLTFDKDEALINDINTTFASMECDYKFVLSNEVSLVKDNLPEVDYVIQSPSNGEFNIGAVTIDKKGKIKEQKIDDLKLYEKNELIQSYVDEFKTKVNSDEVFKVVYKCQVTLNGSSVDNRSIETNLGDFWTDAMLWYYNNNELKVSQTDYTKSMEKDDVVACWNGGNLRDYLNEGDVTMKDLQRVLPYPNKLALVKMKGIDLVEFLEAASQGLPYSNENQVSLAAFMQVSGIEYSVDKSKEYVKGEAYGKSWFKDGNVGSRVTISKINGKDFDANKTYGVIVSNAVANGMDSNYVCIKECVEKVIFDTVVRDAVMEYIKVGLNGIISSTYLNPQGRIVIK